MRSVPTDSFLLIHLSISFGPVCSELDLAISPHVHFATLDTSRCTTTILLFYTLDFSFRTPRFGWAFSSSHLCGCGFYTPFLPHFVVPTLFYMPHDPPTHFLTHSHLLVLYGFHHHHFLTPFAHAPFDTILRWLFHELPLSVADTPATHTAVWKSSLLSYRFSPGHLDSAYTSRYSLTIWCGRDHTLFCGCDSPRARRYAVLPKFGCTSRCDVSSTGSHGCHASRRTSPGSFTAPVRLHTSFHTDTVAFGCTPLHATHLDAHTVAAVRIHLVPGAHLVCIHCPLSPG